MYNQPILTIITLTVPQRKVMLKKLSEEISKQIGSLNVEHLIWPGPETYGQKMRQSLEESQGQYVMWMDDDDWPMPNYIKSVTDTINLKPDVITIGSYSPGCVPCYLRFGVRDDYGYNENGEVIRSANHYCAWRREVALSSVWMHRNYGAEYVFYTLLRLGIPSLKEYHIHEVLHEYRQNQLTTLCQDSSSTKKIFENNQHKITLVKTNGLLGVAIGNQPERGYYNIQFPTGEFGKIPVREVQVLEKTQYR